MAEQVRIEFASIDFSRPKNRRVIRFFVTRDGQVTEKIYETDAQTETNAWRADIIGRLAVDLGMSQEEVSQTIEWAPGVRGGG